MVDGEQLDGEAGQVEEVAEANSRERWSLARRIGVWVGLTLVVLLGLWVLGGNQLLGDLRGPGSTTAPRIGRPAPDFELPDLDGQPVRLSDLRGKTVIINFWASWCRPCRAEMPDIESVYQEYKGRGVVVLAINQLEDRETVASFIDSLDLTFPVVLDSTGEVSQLYRVSGIPTTFFVDPSGNIKQMNVGTMSRLGIVAKLQMAR